MEYVKLALIGCMYIIGVMSASDQIENVFLKCDSLTKSGGLIGAGR